VIVSGLFESELRRRGLTFAVDRESGRYEITVSGTRLLVSVDNLGRRLHGDARDAERVSGFVDSLVAAGEPHSITSAGLYWCLEPNDYSNQAAYRVAVSPQVDRVLVNVAEDESLITWVTAPNLQSIGLSAADASDQAWLNLDAALRRSRLETDEVDGVTLAILHTDFPSKASLVLAPCLRDVVSGAVGWPILAVAPDRDFVYLWNAERRDFIERLGGIVAREYGRAPYPLTTEVLEIGDSVQAIGTFGA
jgi:hypothetical protein